MKIWDWKKPNLFIIRNYNLQCNINYNYKENHVQYFNLLKNKLPNAITFEYNILYYIIFIKYICMYILHITVVLCSFHGVDEEIETTTVETVSSQPPLISVL